MTFLIELLSPFDLRFHRTLSTEATVPHARFLLDPSHGSVSVDYAKVEDEFKYLEVMDYHLNV